MQNLISVAMIRHMTSSEYIKLSSSSENFRFKPAQLINVVVLPHMQIGWRSLKYSSSLL